MKDLIGHPVAAEAPLPPEVKADALHALGHFYMRQGYPKQALALLLAAQAHGCDGPEMIRALAHASLLSGAPNKALEYLDIIEAKGPSGDEQSACRILRGRALLALGRVEDAQSLFRRPGGKTQSGIRRIAVEREQRRRIG